MSDTLKLEVDAEAELRRLRKLRGGLRHAVNGALGDVSSEAIKFIKKNYLLGQSLRKITGETYEHVGQYYVAKTGSWFIRPGIGIRGSQNYLARWLGTDKDFMHRGFTAYAATLNISERVDQAVQKFIDKETK